MHKVADPTVGQSFPLGATVGDGGVNFSVFSRTASGMELVLFDRKNGCLGGVLLAAMDRYVAGFAG
jgi:glycogen operon protein